MWYEDVHFLQLRGTVILMLQILIAICPVEKLACFSLLSNLQGAADRVLIYLTLYISECLKKLQKVCVVQRAHRVAKAARCILGCTDVVLDLFMVGYLLPPLLPLSPHPHTHTHTYSVPLRMMLKSLLPRWQSAVLTYLVILAFPSMPLWPNQATGQKQVKVSYKASIWNLCIV